jgi:3'-phosphoadenosine 5'-phosphosulfate sulfotransferase (PAPS reductase)/FAD synthetase
MISKKWQFLINAPFKISDECCNRLKKEPLDRYAKETKSCPIMGTMAFESNGRKNSYLKKGCSVFNGAKSKSMPLSIWLEQDIYDYITLHDLPISSIYSKGARRTGCIFCMFGAHNTGDNRFEMLKELHPQLYKYCMETLGIRKVMDYVKAKGKSFEDIW